MRSFQMPARRRYQRQPRREVHPRRAPRKAYHIPAVLRDSFAVAMGVLIALSVLLAATGIYQVGYDNGLHAQEVAHAQR